MHKNKTVKICGRPYSLLFNKNIDGAEFSTYSKDGNGEIVLGDYKNNRFLFEVFLHEIIEAILTHDNKRLVTTGFEPRSERYKFLFDHDYLDGFAPKIADALISSGFCSVKDPRKTP
jgi:hypothetical protein